MGLQGCLLSSSQKTKSVSQPTPQSAPNTVRSCWELTICHGGADHRLVGIVWRTLQRSQRLDPSPSRILSGKLDNHLRTRVRKKFLFVLHKEREISAFTKLAVSEFDQKVRFCEIPPNALTCIPLTPIMQRHFWHILKMSPKIDLKLVITVKNRTDIVFDMLPSWSIYIDVYKMCKN